MAEARMVTDRKKGLMEDRRERGEMLPERSEHQSERQAEVSETGLKEAFKEATFRAKLCRRKADMKANLRALKKGRGNRGEEGQRLQGRRRAAATGEKKSRGDRERADLERDEQEQGGNASNGSREGELGPHHHQHTHHLQGSCPCVHVVRPNVIKPAHIIADQVHHLHVGKTSLDTIA